MSTFDRLVSSRRRALVCTLALAAFAPLGAQADAAYPNRPVRLVVPYSTGGNTDLVVRVLAPSLGKQLGQTFVIDNKPGAGGNIGIDIVAKSAPDGYTLANGTLSTYALNVAMYNKLPYDPVKDLVPVALTVMVPLVLVVPSSSGVRTLAQLVQLLKSQPGQHNYASAGNGTSGHIASYLFARMAGVDVQHIPYKTASAEMADILAGRITYMFDAPSVVDAMIKAGRLTAIAVAVPERMKTLPTVPTFDEAGLKNFRAYSWNAVWAPTGTPAAVLDGLNAAINKAVADPVNANKIEEYGNVAYPAMSRAEVEKFMLSEYATWVPIIRSIGVKLD
jgi:tripartite-type tricarboxylate transporter receptor subunit TctC